MVYAKREMDVRVGAMIPKAHKRALDRSADENGRSTASEIRMAIEFWLKKEGRLK